MTALEAVKAGKAKVRAAADKVRARKKTAKEAPPKAALADAVRSAPTPPKAPPSLPSDAPVEIDASILSLSAQKRFEALERRLRADMEAEIERRVREGVREGVRQALAKRDAYDVERIEQANAVLERGSKKPFTAGEYTKILCFALAEGTTTPERREEALKLVNTRKFLLREEGRIVPLSSRAAPLPKTPEDWAAAKAAKTADRKANRSRAPR